MKEHDDIKIRKEASRQIEHFEAIVSSFEGKKGQKDENSTEKKMIIKNTILVPLVDEVKKFYERNDIQIFGSTQQLKEYIHVTQGSSFQTGHYTPIFIDQCLEVS